MPNITSITPPRVPFTDPRTGLISREWYRFFLDMFMLTGSGSNNVSLTDLQVGPPQVNDLLGELGLAIDQTQLSVMMAQYESCCGKLQDLEVSPSAESLIPVVQSIQGLEITPTVCDPRVSRIKDDLDFVLTAPIYTPSAITKPYFEGLNTSASVTLPTTATVFIIPTVVSNSGFIYDTTTGIIQFTQSGNYALEIMINAQPSASNKNMYFYGEVNLDFYR